MSDADNNNDDKFPAINTDDANTESSSISHHVALMSPTGSQMHSDREIRRTDNASTDTLKTAAQRLLRRLSIASNRMTEQFPSDRIYQIDQCIEVNGRPANSSDISGPNQGPLSIKSALSDAVPSSLVTVGDPSYYYVGDLNDFSNDGVPLAEVVQLPVPKNRRSLLCFDETLLVSVEIEPDFDKSTEEVKLNKADFNANGKIRPLLDASRLRHLGGMTIRIKNVGDDIPDDVDDAATKPQFSILVAADFSHENGTAGCVTSIQASVDASFGLLKERRTEALCDRTGKEEFYLNVRSTRERDAYDIQAIHTVGNACSRKSGRLPRPQPRDKIGSSIGGASGVGGVADFVMDGGAFALMRYMVQLQFIGKFDTVGMYVSGEMCRSTYCFSRKGNVLVNNRLSTVVKVRRCIWRNEYVPDISISLYLESGHLVKHSWQGCPYVVHVNPQQDVNRLLESVPLVSDLDERWRDDVRLFERYLTERNDRLIDMRAWVRMNTQATALIRDYVYCLLRTKPQNVLEFTVGHFCAGDADEVDFI